MNSERLHIRLMGSDFELIATGGDSIAISEKLQAGVAEIQRIEALLTEFNDTSVTAQINAQAGIAPVQVPAEVYQLIARCLHISRITQGAFDITASAVKRLFNFKEDHHTWPRDQAIKAALEVTGYQHIQLLEDNKVYLSKQGMRIGFGAMGKGYAAEKVKSLWRELAGKREETGSTGKAEEARLADSGVINASGDLTAWGVQPDGEPWKVGIAHPDHEGGFLAWLPVNNSSVATSGNYVQYVERNGIRYSHNIDPRSGQPVPYIKSVTIVSPFADLSDALATAVTVMGPKVGIHLINQLQDVHCILIDADNRLWQSDKIALHAKA
jgi:FAD:protein FMN transferase